MTTKTVEPCPFCGSMLYRVGGCRVLCLDCLAEGPFKGNDDEAVDAWNNRRDGLSDVYRRLRELEARP